MLLTLGESSEEIKVLQLIVIDLLLDLKNWASIIIIII